MPLAPPQRYDDITPYVDSLHDLYAGGEFQIGLTDLLIWILHGPLFQEVVEQSDWAGAIFSPDMTGCPDPFESYRAAARDWVRDLDIQFVSSGDGALEWVFPVQAFRGALAEEMVALVGCVDLADGGDVSESGANTLELRISVAPFRDGRQIRVFASGKSPYTDYEPIVTVITGPDASVGDPPEAPSPAPLLTLRNTYLATIGVCGGLPWTYTDFFGVAEYDDPEDEIHYLGPFLLTAGWVCEHEVPEEER